MSTGHAIAMSHTYTLSFAGMATHVDSASIVRPVPGEVMAAPHGHEFMLSMSFESNPKGVSLNIPQWIPAEVALETLAAAVAHLTATILETKSDRGGTHWDDMIADEQARTASSSTEPEAPADE